jgi:hypothetical protein
MQMVPPTQNTQQQAGALEPTHIHRNTRRRHQLPGEDTARQSFRFIAYPHQTRYKPTRKLQSLQSSLLLGLSQRNISPGPKVAQISHRKVDAQPHFCSHHNKCHVPATRKEPCPMSANDLDGKSESMGHTYPSIATMNSKAPPA